MTLGEGGLAWVGEEKGRRQGRRHGQVTGAVVEMDMGWVWSEKKRIPWYCLSPSLGAWARMGRWEPPDRRAAPTGTERLTRPRSGQIHVNTSTTLFVTPTLPPQHPSLCQAQNSAHRVC